MPNIFQRIGSAIGRVFTREPAPQAPEPQIERRTFGGRIRDIFQPGRAERERLERDLAREREARVQAEQRAESERQAREQAERELAEKTVPRQPAVKPAPEPAPERDLPKFGGGPSTSDFISRDDRAFGEDSDVIRNLDDAVSNFIADRDGDLDGLSVDAREWLEHPTISEPFGDYWQSGGFTADQVMEGMTNISNVEITEDEDGEIHVEFDYESEIDGYEVSGHASS